MGSYLVGVHVVWIVSGSTKNKKGFCQNCGYNLTGNESGVCPECGTEIQCDR